MKLLLDFLPIVVFFVCFKFAGIYVATAAAIAVTISQLAWMALTGRKIEPMQWVGLAIIVVFGGATLWLQDESFIKWKPTVLYWLMGSALWAGLYVFKRNLMKQLMGAQVELPDHAWGVLLHSWACFFALMGCLNLWVANHFDTDTWVSFKLFGGLGLMLVFVVAQGVYMSRFIKEQPEDSL